MDSERMIRANPFIAGQRDKWEREALSLTAQLAEITGEDPVAVFGEATGYDGARKRGALNPAALSDDRLLNTVLDLRANLKAAQAKQSRRPVAT